MENEIYNGDFFLTKLEELKADFIDNSENAENHYAWSVKYKDPLQNIHNAHNVINFLSLLPKGKITKIENNMDLYYVLDQTLEPIFNNISKQKYPSNKSRSIMVHLTI